MVFGSFLVQGPGFSCRVWNFTVCRFKASSLLVSFCVVRFEDCQNSDGNSSVPVAIWIGTMRKYGRIACPEFDCVCSILFVNVNPI